jgi:hypothetical protein
MTTNEVVQLVGSIVALVVVLNEFLKHIKEWRGGSAELRLLNKSLEFQNDQTLRLMNEIAGSVSKIARRIGL